MNTLGIPNLHDNEYVQKWNLWEVFNSPFLAAAKYMIY